MISNPNAVATPEDINWTDEAFKALLSVRSSTPLLKLISEQEVVERVRFHNTGSTALPGLIAMSVNDGVSAGADLDSNYDAIIVLINANTSAQSIKLVELRALSCIRRCLLLQTQ